MILELTSTTLGVREFKSQPVPEEIVLAILKAGRPAHSTKDEQPWHFILIHIGESQGVR
jgi:nitroreductase